RAARRLCGSPTVSPPAGNSTGRTARPGSPRYRAASTPPTRRTRAGPAGWPGSPSCGAITSCPDGARSGATSTSLAYPTRCSVSIDKKGRPGMSPGRLFTNSSGLHDAHYVGPVVIVLSWLIGYSGSPLGYRQLPALIGAAL